jgi:FAD/FMN-containing dehydrogenase
MMLTTTSTGYDEARLGFQRRDPHRPDVIFPVTSAGEVQAAVRYAIDHDLRIAVQAAGHGLTEGIDGGVLITTGTFNRVTVDTAGRRRGSRRARPGGTSSPRPRRTGSHRCPAVRPASARSPTRSVAGWG